MAQIYQAYEQYAEQNGLVDFAEILLRSHELWLNHPDFLALPPTLSPYPG